MHSGRKRFLNIITRINTYTLYLHWRINKYMNILFIHINNVIFIKINITVISVYHSRHFIIIQILYVIEFEITEFIQICFEITFIRITSIHKIELNTIRFNCKHAFRVIFLNIITCVNTHTLYLLSRSGAEPEKFLLYRLGLSCVKNLKLSLLGEPLFVYEVK